MAARVMGVENFLHTHIDRVFCFLYSAGVIEKLSGNGVVGYSDGDLASAMFNKPRSFTVDLKNNVYVADKKVIP